MEHVAANILWQLGTIFMRYIPPQEKNHVRFKQLGRRRYYLYMLYTPAPRKEPNALIFLLWPLES